MKYVSVCVSRAGEVCFRTKEKEKRKFFNSQAQHVLQLTSSTRSECENLFEFGGDFEEGGGEGGLGEGFDGTDVAVVTCDNMVKWEDEIDALLNKTVNETVNEVANETVNVMDRRR